MIWSYPTLNEFKNARLGQDILSSEDLDREINLECNGQEEHLWVLKKNKKTYLLKNDDVSKLPCRIKGTEIIKDGQKIYHFIPI